MSLLRSEGLSVGYTDETLVVHDVDLHLDAGELVAIIGPNGAGKSTLLRAFVGGVRTPRGRVLIEGRPRDDFSARERARRVALLPQDLPPSVEANVHDFVAGGRYAHRTLFGGDPEGPAVIARSLERVCAEEISERALGTLSGGQRQRALMARALAQEARSLLVDEPTSSLDARFQVGTFALLRDVALEGRGVLAVTHDLNLASQFADRVYLIAEGRVRAEGHPREVLSAETLQPIYGEDLVVGLEYSEIAGEDRPFVLAWRRAGGQG